MKRLSILFFALFSLLAADVAGKYKGTWSGGSASGEIQVTLIPAADGKWTSEVSFSGGGEEVKGHVSSTKVEGSHVELVYDFEIGDAKMQSIATGELSGKTITGKYTTKVLADSSPVDEGTWKATASS